MCSKAATKADWVGKPTKNTKDPKILKITGFYLVVISVFNSYMGIYTASKVSIFGVFLVRIFLHSD